MKYHHKKTNMICFDGFELKQLFEKPIRKWLQQEIIKNGYSTDDLIQNNKAKMHEIVARTKILKSKEDIEIFSALYIFPKFYSKESKICFLLKDGIDPTKENIDSLDKLKNSLKEKDLTDFLLWSDDGFRAYQLKAYTGKTEINELFQFLKKKLLHYCNDLGETNLLINMMSQGDFTGDFFQELHEKIKTLGLKGTGHIIISYNEENKFDVMNTIYPILGTTRIPHVNFN